MDPDNQPIAPTTDAGVPPPNAPVEVELQLRWGDMDINAHINNVQFARLFEEGRVRAFSRWFPDGAERLPILVVRQDVEFRATLDYSLDPVVMRLAITRLGTSSYTIGATLSAADGTLSALARTTMVVVDPSTGRPTPIPPSARKILESHRAQLPELRPRD
ncbi:acyl-CoA thioesterase [Gordonia oryzae]|uniref:Acyl-CoA thioesterase n=1 Tax=Gordonia oryzae TaxID=2487349 RepID=A0A3N4G6V2_9ACTN|nr:thioesterase family protein [Gordonia oryzae]RPA57818.1 acyl-CoA thioesterase [Gordonia oryzae]